VRTPTVLLLESDGKERVRLEGWHFIGNRAYRPRSSRSRAGHEGNRNRPEFYKAPKLTHELSKAASVLVTRGCGESCPFVLDLRMIYWSLPDPKGQSLEALRAIHDEIHNPVKELILSEGKVSTKHRMFRRLTILSAGWPASALRPGVAPRSSRRTGSVFY
jgi:hypothetical protein